MFKTKLIVRYSETDQMGVVHHSRYFPWFEVGRTEFFKNAGFSYGEIERQGVLLPLVDCYCKFLEGAKYEDEIYIQVNLKKLGVAKCVFEYRVIRCCDEKLLALGYTTHGFTDKQFKPLNIRKTNLSFYNVLKELSGESIDT